MKARSCAWARRVPALSLALTLAAPAAAVGEEELPLAWARYAVEGPLGRVELIGTRGRSVLDLDLRAGERRELELPFLHLRAAGPPRAEGADRGWDDPGAGAEPVAAGRVRFLGWVERPAPTLPAALRARPRPPWRPAPPRVPPELALLLLALGPVTFALRRRPLLLGAVAVLVTGLAAFVQARAAPPLAPLQRVLEGTRDGQRWMAVDVARSLQLEPERPIALAVEPQGTAVEIRVTLRGGPPRSVVESARGALVGRAPLDPGLRLLTPGLNTWGALAEVWTRPARDSDWRAHGAWGLGETLAPGGPGRPPGWLAAGAVQGRGILVGRLGQSTWDGGGASRERSPAADTWLRLVGFE